MIRLRVDNNFIELEEKTDLSFIFENQLYSSDIKLSRTIEFNIPATSNNKKFLNFANRPDFDGNKIRYKYIAELWYSGGKIDGELLINEFSDNNFKAIFIYGNLLKFKEIKEKGEISTYLNLPDKIEYPYQLLNYLDNINSPVPFAFFNYLNGVPDDEKLDGVINLMPTVNFNYLLQSCADFLNILLNFPENYDSLSKKLGIVLNKMKISSYLTITDIQGNSLTDFTISGDAEINTYFSKSNLNFYFYEQYTDSYGTVRYRIVNKALKCLTAEVPMLITFNDDLNFAIQKNNSALKNFGTVNSPRFTIQSGDSVYINKGESFQFILTNYYTFVPRLFGNDYYTSVNLTTTLNNINFVAKCEDAIDLQYGDAFPLNENLPKLTFLDLLNIFANLTYCSFIWNEDTQTIEFFNYEFNKSNFIDLTERLISINNVKRYLPNFAQNNYIRCNSDKYVKEFNKFKINLQLFNENLETEKDYYVIPLNEGNENENREVLITDFEEDKLVAEKGTLIYYNTDTAKKYHFHINKFKEENDTFIQKNFLDIINNSTTIEVKVQMYLHEFLKINEKTLYKINTILYNVISATFSNNICTLTLVKI